MYDYKMFCLGGNLVYLLENFGKLHRKISRKTKQLISTFPFDKLYNIYVIFKCENYLYYDNKF